MREIRPSGSEGGAGLTPRPYLYPWSGRLARSLLSSSPKCYVNRIGYPAEHASAHRAQRSVHLLPALPFPLAVP
jgi:hypothetical protein